MLRNKFAALAALISLFITNSARAQSAEPTIDEIINERVGAITGPFVNFIFSPLPGSEAMFGYAFPWIVLWLVIAATNDVGYFFAPLAGNHAR